MKRTLAPFLLLGLMAAVPAFAETSVHVGINIGAPPPAVVYHHEPRWVMVPNERVYVVDDDALGYDYFRYGGWYWIYDNDNWYRARRYRGPFVAVRADWVPAPIWHLRASNHYRWRHRPGDMPPGLAKKYGRGYGHGDYGRGDDHGRGHGNGRGH